LYSCYLLSSAIGPIVSIIMILTVSANAEVWSIDEIYPVFLLGVILEIPAAILMFFFDDRRSVVEPEEEVALTSPSEDGEATSCDGGIVNLDSTLDVIAATDDDDERELVEHVGFVGDVDTTGTETSAAPLASNWRKQKAIIPYILFVSSLISSLGSGASVKYFPLFFKEIGFGSAAVQGIFLMVPISISLFSFVAQEMGKRFGRVETTVFSIAIGVSLLFWMTWLSHDVGTQNPPNVYDGMTQSAGPSTTSLWKVNPYRASLIVIVYLFRTGIINCSYPLLESILMDNVPSNQRARWKSLEAIASFGWTGSALVGGILSDEHSYQFTFSMTAWMQVASGLILLIIRPLVEQEGE
jgi:Major Facilitator Superfamily